MASKNEFENEKVNISQFILNWSSLMGENEHQKTDNVSLDDYLKIQMETDDAMVAELDTVCGIDTLNCDGEVEDRNIEVRHKYLKEIPKNIPLLTTEFQRHELKLREDPARRNALAKVRGRRSKFREAQILHMMKQTDESCETNIMLPEAIINVRIYYPYQSKTLLRLSQEFQVLASQKLTDLRDKVSCVADSIVVGEFSDRPTLPKDIISGDLYKSSFFFIENTFYNDMRDENCRDYSAVIQRWATERTRGLGPYTSAKMEEFCFSDLTVRLGYPYVYLHQGDCEHIVMFSDIRMVHREDCWDVNYYPMAVGKPTQRRQYCKACQTNVSTWVIRCSTYSPEDPCFFCDTCFKSFHYTTDQEKIGDFNAYPYPNGGVPWT